MLDDLLPGGGMGLNQFSGNLVCIDEVSPLFSQNLRDGGLPARHPSRQSDDQHSSVVLRIVDEKMISFRLLNVEVLDKEGILLDETASLLDFIPH